jgi:hypothetical protein
MPDQLIGTILCTDGQRREVFEDFHGKQYILNDADERVYGLWNVSESEFPDLPVIVDGSGNNQ